MVKRSDVYWRILPAVGFAVVLMRPAVATTLRIAEYNIDSSDQGNNNNVSGPTAGIPAVIEAMGLHHIGTNAQPVDVIALTELLDATNTTSSSTLPLLVSALNSFYGAGTYAYDPTPDPTTGGVQFNGPSGIIYNTHTVQVVSAVALAHGGSGTSTVNRAPMRYQLQPIGYGSDSSFYMYVDHYKASSGTTNQAERNTEAVEVRQNADTLGSNAHIIYTGDMNLTGGSTEPAYQTLLAAGNGQAHDPLVTSWTNSTPAFNYLYSESTTSLTARFDVQLVSGAVLNQPGLQLATDTSDPFDPNNFPSSKYGYAEEIFGNNGSTAEGKATNLSTNTSLHDLANASTILADMMQPAGSDHLPIVADYSLVGVNPLPAVLTWLNAGGSGDGITWDTSTNQNWNNGTAAAAFHAGDTVTFNDSNAGHYAVTISGANSPAALTVNNSVGNYVFSGTGSIAGNTGLTKSGTGSLTIGTANSYAGGTVVSGGTIVVANVQALGTGGLTIHANGAVQLQAGLAAAVVLLGVTLDGSSNAWQGKLDVTNNKLVVQDSANHAATYSLLQNQVFFGTTHSAGILSTVLPANTALAVIDNAALSTAFTTFGGAPVNSGSILIAPELLGDTNADGHVDLTDLSTVLNNFGSSTLAWTSGNFDGGTTVDLTDLSDVLNNFGLSFAGASDMGGADATAGLNVIATPESASLAILTFAMPMLLKRRARKVS